MTEKQTTSENLYEKAADVEQFGEIAHERREAIHNALEDAERKHKEHHSSEREILARAKDLADQAEESVRDRQPAPAERRRTGPINKKQLAESFKSQMKHAETEMSTSERVFSRFLHSKPVEKTTDALGSTVARPNAMLSGSIAAFLGVTILYFVAKYYGFQLSGSETILTFIAGWIIGILYDYFSVMIRGHKK